MHRQLRREDDAACAHIFLIDRAGFARSLAVLDTEADLRQWLRRQRRTWVDPTRYASVAHAFYEQTLYIQVSEWNKGERIKFYRERSVWLPGFVRSLGRWEQVIADSPWYWKLSYCVALIGGVLLNLWGAILFS